MREVRRKEIVKILMLIFCWILTMENLDFRERVREALMSRMERNT